MYIETINPEAVEKPVYKAVSSPIIHLYPAIYRDYVNLYFANFRRF